MTPAPKNTYTGRFWIKKQYHSPISIFTVTHFVNKLVNRFQRLTKTHTTHSLLQTPCHSISDEFIAGYEWNCQNPRPISGRTICWEAYIIGRLSANQSRYNLPRSYTIGWRSTPPSKESAHPFQPSILPLPFLLSGLYFYELCHSTPSVVLYFYKLHILLSCYLETHNSYEFHRCSLYRTYTVLAISTILERYTYGVLFNLINKRIRKAMEHWRQLSTTNNLTSSHILHFPTHIRGKPDSGIKLEKPASTNRVVRDRLPWAWDFRAKVLLFLSPWT